MRRRWLVLVAVLCLAPVARAEEAPSCSFGPGDLPATTNPGGLHGAQIPIDHIVVLFQENHSFDNYLSHLPSAEALPPGAANPDPTGGRPIKPFHALRLCASADLDHSWNGTHQSWNGGAMDGFTRVNVDPTDPTGSRAMAYYTRSDLPYYYGLYSLFATSDRHFCSVLGPSLPNWHYLYAGTSFGRIVNDISTVTGRTIFGQLDDAVVSWRIYAEDTALEVALYADVRASGGANVAKLTDYFADAAAGALPQVSFIRPALLRSDEHPPENVQVGQKFVGDVLGALMASPLWGRSAAIVTYDEHGGYWDHVPPPPACVPDDMTPLLGPADEPGAFDRYGIRVPLLVVSPFARRRYLSHTTTDQTSVLRFIQTRFDLPALTRRDANADPLLEMFDFANPAFLVPPRLPRAVVDAQRAAECSGEVPGPQPGRPPRLPGLRVGAARRAGQP